MAYKGLQIRYPLGELGFDGIRNLDLMPPGGLSRAENIQFDTSSITKAGGLAIYDSDAISGTPNCLGGHDWHPSSTTQRQITVWSNGDLYKETSGDQDAVTLDSGDTYNRPVVFIEGGQETGSGNRKLFVYMEGMTPKVLSADGATTSDLSAIPSPDWDSSGPAAALWHDFRIYAFGHPTYPHTVYTSNIYDHGDFTSGEPTPPIFQVAPGSGERISAMTSDIQKNSRDLYVFKYPRGIFRIDTTSITSAWIPVDTVNLDVGCPGPNALAQVEDDIWFIGHDGHIYSLRGVATSQNVGRVDLTHAFRLEDWLEEFVGRTEDKLRFAKIIYDPREKEVWVSYKSPGNDLCDKVLIINIENPGKPRISTDVRGQYFEAMWLSRESSGVARVFAGGEGGLFYKANDKTTTIGGASYGSVFELPETTYDWYNEDLRTRNKRFDWLEFSVVDRGNGTFTVEYSIDGSDYGSTNVTLHAEGDLLDYGALDSFVLGGGLRMRTYKVFLGGFGQRLGLKFSNSDGQDFEVTSLSVFMKPIGSKGEQY